MSQAIEYADTQETVAELGREMVEDLQDSDTRPKVKEKWQSVSETFEKVAEEDVEVSQENLPDDSSLYSTMIAQFIEDALQPRLVALDVMREINFDLNVGYDSIKIPKDNLLTASDLNSDGTFPSEETTGYDDLTINISWVGAYTSIPAQLLRKSAVDLAAHRLRQIGEAIARKVDSDIITDMTDATDKNGSYGDNGNYLYGGNNDGSVNSDDGFDSNKEITYDVLVNAQSDMMDNNAMPDVIVTNNQTWGRLMTDADMKDALAFGTTTQGEIPMVQQFGDMRLVPTGQMPSNQTVLVDTDNAGYFVDASGVETFDGRVSNTVQFEVVAIKGYGVGQVRPKALFGIKENTDEPA